MFLGAINQLITARQQRREADRIKPVDATYTESPYAKEMLQIARMRTNAAMPGAGTMARGIQQNVANTMYNTNRGASSGNQVLAMAGAAQAQADEAGTALVGQELAFDQANQAQMQNALQVGIGEGDKVFADKLRKFERDFQARQALIQSSMQNRQGAFNAFDNGAARIAAALLTGGTSEAMGGFKKKTE